MGVELELYLTPPTVPGLSFNMAFSYQDSELGAFKNIDHTDVGGHLRGDAASSKWHLAKNAANATHVLLDKDILLHSTLDLVVRLFNSEALVSHPHGVCSYVRKYLSNCFVRYIRCLFDLNSEILSFPKNWLKK